MIVPEGGSILQKEDVHLPAEGGAGVHGNDPAAVIGGVIRVRAEFRALVFIFGVPVGGVPVAADHGLPFRADRQSGP